MRADVFRISLISISLLALHNIESDNYCIKNMTHHTPPALKCGNALPKQSMKVSQLRNVAIKSLQITWYLGRVIGLSLTG